MGCGKPDREAVAQNLRDAGCDQAFIERFLRALERGALEEQQRLLACQRCRLLECVHTQQKKLECLDYLRYQLKNRMKQE